MIISLLWVTLALGAMILGSDLAVGAARRIARRLGVSDLTVGLTITSIGTSLPELATSATAAIASGGAGGADAAGVAVGNIVGSNLFLLTGLMGIAGIMHGLSVKRQVVARDGGVLMAATVVFIIFAISGNVSRFEGAALTVAYFAYLAVVIRQDRLAQRSEQDLGEPAEPAGDDAGIGGFIHWVPGGRWTTDGSKLIVGLAVLVLSATAVVDHGVELAVLIGVPGVVIGVMLGVGTSLPELVVSVRSALIGAADVSLGNILGSGITNLLLCAGVAALAHPLAVQTSVLLLDIPFLLAATAIGLALMFEQEDVTRAEGFALIVLFLLYLFVRSTAGV